MKVIVDIRPRRDLPGLGGAHELSWSYILDRVMADAYHHQLGCLRVVLPAAALQEALAARALPGAEAEGGEGRGLALLAGGLQGVRADDDRLYLLDFGGLGLGGARRDAHPGAGWALEARLHVFSLRARLLGIPIRLAQALRRPDWADRAMFGMRRAFASERPVPATYALTVWGRETGGGPQRPGGERHG